MKDAFCKELKQGLVELDLKADIQTEEGIRQLSNMICKTYRDIAERRTQNDAFALIQENFQKNKVYLHEYFPTIHTMFDDILVPESLGNSRSIESISLENTEVSQLNLRNLWRD